MRFSWLALLACGLVASAAQAQVFDDETQRIVQHPAVAAADWGKAVEVQVELHDNTYEPSNLSFRIGQPYILTLKNVGKVSHDMVGGTFFQKDVIALRMVSTKFGRVTADDISSVYIRPKQEAELWFVPLKKGDYSFICTIPGHREDGMEGDIRIVD